jgi:hypothetical protein
MKRLIEKTDGQIFDENHAGSLKLQKRSNSTHSEANAPANKNAAPAFQ